MEKVNKDFPKIVVGGLILLLVVQGCKKLVFFRE